MIATAKPASTVVLLDSQSRVYLTKRPYTMKFMGGYYVFPGGAVDKWDYEFEQQHDSIANITEHIDSAFYIAAIRELFEEVGILMVKNELTMDINKQDQYRQSLIKGEISLLEMVRRENLSLNFDLLTHIAHFTTPKIYPIRYDTRFFLAQLPKNQTPSPDKREVADATWLTAEESLEASKKRELLLSLPTKRVLKTVMTYHV